MYPQLVIKFAIVIAFGALFTTTYFQNPAPASAAPDGLLINVNDTADLVGTKPGDGNV